ncbi:MarR family winged helix-turn-helix transcriptional regulator [Salinibacterium hongtaonis]|uniref:MarR family winged helix-turn-helix transcriptional regulator n=1 Tax=Homoserinimonas hongtaonis TaxID=2079791 RepID=UPI001F5463BE|nr:MarR family transcriptional regulator [Salinibacterium hongtaonis]
MPIVDHMVCFSLYSATRATTRAYTELLEPWGLTYTQYLVLVVLWAEGPQPVHEMGSLLQLDSGTLSPLLKRMQSKGLLERRRDSDDNRVVTIVPTEKAIELRDELDHIPLAIAQATGLPDVGAAQELIETLQRLTLAMREINSNERQPTP